MREKGNVWQFFIHFPIDCEHCRLKGVFVGFQTGEAFYIHQFIQSTEGGARDGGGRGVGFFFYSFFFPIQLSLPPSYCPLNLSWTGQIFF